jgi:hypothetical protein
LLASASTGAISRDSINIDVKVPSNNALTLFMRMAVKFIY